MAKEERFTFLSSDGKTQIQAVKWIPEDGTYSAILQITHGMIEFVERYKPFAKYLTEHGFLVVDMTISDTAVPCSRRKTGDILQMRTRAIR